MAGDVFVLFCFFFFANCFSVNKQTCVVLGFLLPTSSGLSLFEMCSKLRSLSDC